MRNAGPLGPLMVDVAGREITSEDREILQHPLVGGVILFTRNYEDPRQIQSLIEGIRSVNGSLLIAVDYEGGRVQRFRQGGFTILPPARAFGRLFDKDRERALALARDSGFIISTELRSVGADLCFAPILDLEAGVSAVIGDRAFHTEAKVVAEIAQAMMQGLCSGGMAATGKHFPGHGQVVEDSHVSLPTDTRSLEQIRASDMSTFEILIRADLPSIMMAHILFPAVDSQPASLSRRWITEELRGRLEFRGAVFCDDLSMGGAAAAGSYQDRAGLALEAGCDMLPVCNNRAAVIGLIDDLRFKPDRNAAARLVRLRAETVVSGLAEAQKQLEWRQAHERLSGLT